MKIVRFGRGLAALMGLALAGAALAQQAYPVKPIRLLVGFAPGGSGDTVARLVAAKLGDGLGQPVLVENRAGAGGVIAAEAVVRAAPDGYTWVLLPSGHATQGAMIKTLPYHPVNDFAWVSTITTYPMVFAVASGSAISSFADLIQRARTAPGKLTYPSVGIGTGHHLLGEWVNAEAGIELTHVPFKGGTSPMTEVLAGRVDVLIETMTVALAQIRAGKLRVLGVSSARPFPLLPGAPRLAETLPSIDYDSWLGIATTPGTPAPVVARIHAEVKRVVALDDIRTRLSDLGGQPQGDSPEEFRARVERDIAKFRRIVETRRIEAQ